LLHVVQQGGGVLARWGASVCMAGPDFSGSDPSV
jgi:hypothetical protein